VEKTSEIWPNLIGGEIAKKLLGSSLTHDKLVHNYLLEGPLGVGKFAFGVAFAGSLACTKSTTGFACGVCDDCKLFYHGRHPDVLIMSREQELSVDEARRIREIISLSPLRLDRRIILLDGIDKLKDSAGNTLLKMLEEAPGGAVFILTTHRPDRLLPTILSRSLRVPFRLVPKEKMPHLLEKVLGVSRAKAEIASDLSGGRPGWAIRLLLHPQLKELYDYGKILVGEEIIKRPLGRIFQKETLIRKFIENFNLIFGEQDEIKGYDGQMISRLLNGEPVDFSPVNLFTENEKKSESHAEAPSPEEDTKKKTVRHLDMLGFVVLGEIYQSMMEHGEIEGGPARYHRLMEAFLVAPRNLERYFNRDLVIESFILAMHGRLES
jgi:hypothetical protein